MNYLTRFLLIFVIIFNLSACGTILYPERKGQVGGRLDVGVVLLNAVGLLVYFIPGVIAFAVDFSNGTIYLPGGISSNLSDEQLDQLSAAERDPESLRVFLSELNLSTAAGVTGRNELKIVALARGESGETLL